MILGRPFLATSNAIINCRSGQLRLSFGHLTIELNIFHQPQYSEIGEVDVIETVEEDTSDLALQEISLASINISTMSFEKKFEDELKLLNDENEYMERLKDNFKPQNKNLRAQKYQNLVNIGSIFKAIKY